MPTLPWLDRVRFSADGLVPVVAQEARSGDVLMLAWANRDALEKTQESGEAHYYSRSRQALWKKGETSGHGQALVEMRLDCDGDTVLYRVRQTGPACHTGTRTCFSSVLEAGRVVPQAVERTAVEAELGSAQADGDDGHADGSAVPVLVPTAAPPAWRDLPDPGGHLLGRLAALVHRRATERTPGSYTVSLLDRGVPKVSQKVGEEAVEVVVAANAENGERLASEAADLLYHLTVLLEARGVALDTVLEELERRSR